MNVDTRNTQFDAIDRAFRKQYIAEKMRSMKTIMSEYVRGIKYVGANLIGSKYEFQPKFTNLILTDVMKSLKTAEKQVARTYLKEIERIGSLGTSNITMQLEVAGTTLSDDFLKTVSQLPAQQALEQVYSTAGIANTPLSSRIWNDKDKEAIIRIIQRGIANQESPYDIAQKLYDYSMSGKGMYNAYRLAFTEVTYAFNKAKMDLIRDWNNNPISDFEIGVKQYLSPYHNIYDICDVLEGTYTVDSAPTIPRHPNCECGQKFVIIDGKTSKEIKDNLSRLPDDLMAFQEAG